MSTSSLSDPAAGAALIERLAQARIACVGDLMLDRFHYGAVDRISPEAPIPVLRVTDTSAMPGGAGNVAANLAALGASVDLVGLRGADAAGEELAALLAAQGIDDRVVASSAARTTLKTRFIAQAQQLLRADEESEAALAPEAEAAVVAAAEAAIAGAGAVILSDYGKGVLTPRVIAACVSAASAAGAPVIVDPKGRDFARYRGATLATPNLRELAEASGGKPETDAAIIAAADALRRQAGISGVVVTRGPQGMTILPPGEESPFHLRAEAREVFDVSGAGDTVVAVLAAGLASGAGLADSARLSNAAAGLVVARPGTATVTRGELARALHQAAWSRSEGKIADATAAARRVTLWRQRGQRIGFTNGCFDLLHPGHIALLARARAACDRLVVGLNTDASIRRLKGPDRPVQNEAARATVLASLESVDIVVPFAEDTPLALIEALRPDLLVKGADYTIETVVGAALVQGWGGEVMLAPLEAGHSTTRLIARSRAEEKTA